MRISVINSTTYIDFDDWRIVKVKEDTQEVKNITQPKLYQILEYFAQHPGEVISKKELLKAIWGKELNEYDPTQYDNMFYPQIRHLRDLLGEDLASVIRTTPGGYKYDGEGLTDKNPISSLPKLNMADVRGFAIGDTDHSACQIRRDESDQQRTTAVVDFSLAGGSELCSICYFVPGQDWSAQAQDGHMLCFNACAFPGPVQAELEVRLKGRGVRDFSLPILLQEDMSAYSIPLTKIASSPEAWEEVDEIHLLFHRRAVSARTAVTIENLCVKKKEAPTEAQKPVKRIIIIED